MKKLTLCFGLLLMIISCTEKEQKPDYLWTEDHFVDVMVEMQKAEAIIRLGYHKQNDTIYATDSIYAAALRKMNATKVDFDSNYSYYINHPKKFEKLYDQVIVKLSEASALVEKGRNKVIEDSVKR